MGAGFPLADPSISGQLPGSGLLPANFLNHTPKSWRREELFSFSWIFVRRKELRFRLRSLRVNAGAELHEVRFCLSHFPHRRTSSKRIGPRAAPRLFCGDAQRVKLIRSSVTDAAASKRMMSITIGLAFVAVAVPVARGPSPSSRCFLSRTRTTVC